MNHRPKDIFFLIFHWVYGSDREIPRPRRSRAGNVPVIDGDGLTNIRCSWQIFAVFGA
ncbi:hypothetical protein V0288_02280 [Pannus brasiliensis CCIBt3594]|uniref:Uncharacterized protein n=1 Tax=Pannus brasiliensis CCIBt3594 TaxID=1427578 RepID=A0AAW9QLB0_9CHRO